MKMIKVVIVPDTNVLLAGMLGIPGSTRKILNFALSKRIVMFGSSVSYREFLEKIKLPRVQKYFKNQYFTQEKISLEYRFCINMVKTKGVYDGQRITDDPDDDEFFRIAKASGSRVIVSRDAHVLKVKKFDGIITVTPERFMEKFYKLECSRFA